MSRSFILIVLVFVFLRFDPALAFTLCSSTSSGMAGWQTKLLKFKLNPTNCPANINDIVDTAMALWNSAPTSNLIIKREGTSTEVPANLVDPNYVATDVAVIACDNTFSTNFGTNFENSVAGVGVCRIQGGAITRGYLILNTQAGGTANISTFSTTRQHITVAHEIGHVIGLGHSSDQSAMMFYDITSKTKLGLAQDDIDGLTYLYPRSEISGDLPFGCGSVSNINQKPPSGPTALLWLFPFFFIATLRILSRGKFSHQAHL
ncbi:MAG: matrixin family metalloprotease [Oligoflexia bacterium]|nr:matrixin family metalloprotease [Oligoflexia bacterium]